MIVGNHKGCPYHLHFDAPPKKIEDSLFYIPSC